MGDTREPQFDVITSDVIEAVDIGRAVQEAELDATVRVHPWAPPGQIILINRAALTDFATPPKAVEL